ncbi:AraC family transcriptional regulator, partial [Lachnospiraceae bacterium OttesenSCG-928-D06]|nr:AraC family transcriptional regulator [Lachnospiraceae bacterium OttesenSCG-928-D06]
MEEKILKHIMKLLHTTVRVYHTKNGLLGYYGDTKDNDGVLHDGELLNTFFLHTSEEHPYIYQDFYPVYFISVRKEQRLFIIGPIRCDEHCKKIKEQYTVGEYYAKIHKLSCQNVGINFCEMQIFVREALLLFNILHDKDMTLGTLLSLNYKEDVESIVKKELNKVYFHYQEKEKLHNPYDQELRELNAVREGNMENLIRAMEEEFEGEYATLSRDSLRSLKNLAIVSLALVCRAAIEGGMLPEESYSLSDSYILQIDSAVNMMQIAAIIKRGKIEYTQLVHDIRLSNSENRLVEEVKNLIFKKMHDKIVIGELAKSLSVTPEYLSSLFKKVEGITISAYIRQKKIGLAENLLKYSEYSIEEIAYYLGFCSQSHLGKHFMELKHMSPNQYRKKYGRKK